MASDLKIGMKCIKYMLFVVNLTFVITSMLLITSGGTIHAIYSDFRHFLSDSWFSPAVLMMVVGIVMFFISAFGCWGAIKESTCMINTFGVMLAAIFMVEFAGAVAAFAMQHELTSVLTIKMENAFRTYENNSTTERREAVDFLQYRLYCCGVNGPDYWQKNGMALPESCCDARYQPAQLSGSGNEKFLRMSSNITFRDDFFGTAYPAGESSAVKSATEEEEPKPTTSSGIEKTTISTDQPSYPACIPHKNGCYSRLTTLISSSAAILGSGATAVALMQLLGVIFAFSLARAIRRAKTQRAVRTWQQRMGHIISMQVAPYTQLEEKRSMENSPVTYAPSDPSVL